MNKSLGRRLSKVLNPRFAGRMSFGETGTLLSGLEKRTDPASYHWDGMQRGGDPAHPMLIFQYTLSGWGIYSRGGKKIKMTPGMAFNAMVPSQHQYYLPRESPHWTFFYIIINHPYIMLRLKQVGFLDHLTLGDDHPLINRAEVLFASAQLPHLRDEVQVEQEVFEWFFEYERLRRNALYPQEKRGRLLDETRHYVLKNLSRPFSIEELAKPHQKSQSHFSHFFKSITGLSPASYVSGVRCEEVRRRLKNPGATLKQIAEETGFADANHLCKVFRRHFRMSPGSLRRQLGM
jgi:AraC-like DNA-binding protein